MIKIMNPEFFRIETETILSDCLGKSATLISLFTDPRDFELPYYRRVPFMSIVIYGNKMNVSDMTEDELIEYLKKTNFIQHSMYEDGGYDKLTKKFNPDNKYHTLIFEQTDSKEVEEKMLLVFATPCNGIIRQVKKSEYYKLYNASLIVLKERPFKWEDVFYDKIVYGLVDIDANFEFSEFVFTDAHNDTRRMNVHYFAVNTNVVTDETSPIYVDELDIVYNKLSSVIPCRNSEERQELFQYYGKGMFCLSDIPENLTQRGGMVSVRLK